MMREYSEEFLGKLAGRVWPCRARPPPGGGLTQGQSNPWNYWLGGKDYCYADRKAGDKGCRNRA